MMKPKINIWIIVGIFLFIIVVGFYFLVYKSLDNEKNTLMESIENNRQMLLKYQLSYKKNLEEWEKFKESLQRFAELEQKLPTKEDLPHLLAFVESICKESKLSINSFKPIQVQEQPQPTTKEEKKEAPKPLYEERDYSVDLQGSYGGFLLFLAKLKTAPRIILLKDLKIDPVDTTAKELKFSFILSTFIIK
jgi:type IV pilus assembly protein PilO